MIKTAHFAIVSLAVVSLAATAALVGDPTATDAAQSASALPSTNGSTNDWNRRGTRDGSEFAPRSSDGFSAELPRRGTRGAYETLASVVETPDEWSRRGSR